MDTVAILGAGAWGTALAIHLTRTRSTPAIRLWARDATQAAALGAVRENVRYLPGAALPSSIVVTANLEAGLADRGHRRGERSECCGERGATTARRYLPCLCERGHYGRGGRRRGQERAGDRCGRERRARVRTQCARGADHARSRGHRSFFLRARREARDAHGPRRAGRPRADLHRRSVA